MALSIPAGITKIYKSNDTHSMLEMQWETRYSKFNMGNQQNKLKVTIHY